MLRPTNVLVVLSDEHMRHVLGSYGNPIVRTPHLDALAREGTRFASAYCRTPICVPSRGSLATGRWPHTIDSWDNATPYVGTEASSWGHRLTTQGHHVTTIGKLHYVHHVEAPPELFDLAADPDELHDLALDPGHDTVRRGCEAELARFVDPQVADARARAHQRRRLDAGGGMEHVRGRRPQDHLHAAAPGVQRPTVLAGSAISSPPACHGFPARPAHSRRFQSRPRRSG
jgi:arylsulfatase A-like enzyme